MLAKVLDDKIYGLDVNERPVCSYCGGTNQDAVFITPRLFKVVECRACKLWFNSPRIDEEQWLEWNFDVGNVVNKNFVVNRLLYGVMFDGNIKDSHNQWRMRRGTLESNILEEFEDIMDGRRLERVHDVGTGVGFSLAEARRRGITATGNEINAFAHKVMTEIFGFAVFLGCLKDMSLKENSLDAVIMRDYIEHSYHPMDDLAVAFKFLKPGGVLFLETFNIDSNDFKKEGIDWSFMGTWDHVYYFSKWTIFRMAKDVGFRPARIYGGEDRPLVKLYLRKPNEQEKSFG